MTLALALALAVSFAVAVAVAVAVADVLLLLLLLLLLLPLLLLSFFTSLCFSVSLARACSLSLCHSFATTQWGYVAATMSGPPKLPSLRVFCICRRAIFFIWTLLHI